MLSLLTLSALAAAGDTPCGPSWFVSELAGKGQLHAEQRTCLESLANTESPYRASASQVLIEDAHQRGRRGTWKLLVERHLNEIDATDRDVVMDYARFMFVSDRSADALATLDLALEASRTWEDPVAELAIHRMRTVVAVQLWREGRGDVEAAHDRAAAWWQASELLGRPEGTARSLCVSTGDATDCGEAPVVADAR